MCGNKDEACCADQVCNEGLVCNAYNIYGENPGLPPTWLTCQECGGFYLSKFEDNYRVGQLACTGEHSLLPLRSFPAALPELDKL
jgi:hypothetical protein